MRSLIMYFILIYVILYNEYLMYVFQLTLVNIQILCSSLVAMNTNQSAEDNTTFFEHFTENTTGPEFSLRIFF